MTLKSLLILIVLAGQCLYCCAQDNRSAAERITDFPERFFTHVDKKITSYRSTLDRKTEKYLRRLLNKEKKLRDELSRNDSVSAAKLFHNVDSLYADFSAADTNNGTNAGEYIPFMDSLKTSLRFLHQNEGFIASAKHIKNKVGSSLQQVSDLQNKLAHAEKIKKFIQDRKDLIKRELSLWSVLPGSIAKAYSELSKEAYYYSQQIREYKEMLKNGDKLARKAFDVLSRTKPFQQFISRYSELTALFGVPDNYGTPQGLIGLQTRDQVQQIIQTQLSTAGPNARQLLQDNLQAAQQQLSSLKDKIIKTGGGNGELEMPDFKPRTQKTRSFLQRLEFGTNLQTAKSNFFFPTTTDFGLSVGYKLGEKSIVGIGASYKVGWGQDFRHIKVTSEGAGLRSFLDVKLKGSFYASGGFEYNYHPAVPPGQVQIDAWTKSGLVGISKIISLKTKFFKKTRLQLLWDFLSYEQVTRSQPVKFRVGYNF